jgi:hypothetical protein
MEGFRAFAMDPETPPVLKVQLYIVPKKKGLGAE